MPTYIYECEEHGEFEEYHKITEKLEFCPKCKTEHNIDKPVKRLIASSTKPILKGGCWASDNYSK